MSRPWLRHSTNPNRACLASMARRLQQEGEETQGRGEAGGGGVGQMGVWVRWQ